MDNKTCTECRETKPLSMFYVDTRGYPRPRCADCYNGLRKRVQKVRQYWTDEQDDILRNLYPTGGWEAVAKLTGRGDRSIRNRAHLLGVHMVRPEGHEAPLRKGQEPAFGIPADDRPEEIKALDYALRCFRECEPAQNLTWILSEAA